MRKHKFFAALCLLMAFCTQWSCTEDYEYTKNEPKWMGESLYATLKGDKRFTIYLQMLQRMDSAYVAVLDKTGSRTLFVPDDDAFKAFFQSNPYGYNSVADMPTSLISEFLKYYTLENAYVTTMLGYSENYTPGDCLRRYTTFNNTDTIPYVDNFPDNPQFAKFRGKKMYLSSPGNWTLTNFTQLYFSAKAFTADDFNKLYPNRTWNNGDVYIFDAKIVDKDIISKNGYIHVVDKVVLPPKNMYEHLRDNEDI
ncbi:MAG: fasciclin domain-containing protein, partial [Prevotellaceae bacterium]|nr:fasciclin domain-containing protein [Prevotellaceae bacterium]